MDECANISSCVLHKSQGDELSRIWKTWWYIFDTRINMMTLPVKCPTGMCLAQHVNARLHCQCMLLFNNYWPHAICYIHSLCTISDVYNTNRNMEQHLEGQC